nr:aldo/keto reductase [Streptomyces sp. SID14478]
MLIGGDLPVSRMGFGAMHLTGPGMWGEHPDPEHCVRILRRAVDLGVTFIDTADAYGPGTNERIIRKALHPYPAGLVISTKGGLLRTGPGDWTGPSPYVMPLGRPEYLRQQVELSLANLGVDTIDLYQLHAIDPTVPLDEQIGVLATLQDQGKIRHIGLSGQPGITVADLDRARALAPIAAVENLYNLAERTGTVTLNHAEHHQLAFIPWFPLGHGQLAGCDSPLAPLADHFDAKPAQLALAWLLHVSHATLPIPGTTSLHHLEQNMRATDIHLTPGDLDLLTSTIDAAGLTTWAPPNEIAAHA